MPTGNLRKQRIVVVVLAAAVTVAAVVVLVLWWLGRETSDGSASDALGAALAIFDDVVPDTPPGESIVFVSVSDGSQRASVGLGTGPAYEDALAAALADLRLHWPANASPVWVKLDVVTTIESLEGIDPTALPFDPSLAGFALDWDGRLAFLPEEIVANTLVDSDGQLRFDNLAAYAPLRLVSTAPLAALEEVGSIDIQVFWTDSFFSDGTGVIPLFRGHRTFDQVDTEVAAAAAAAAAPYLIASVDEEGRFVYRYLPKTDTVPDAYNIVRHGGAAFSMAQLYAATGDPELLAATQRAIGYLVEPASQPCTAPVSEAAARCIVEGGTVKLGANALAVLAMAEYALTTSDEQFVPVMLELAEWIVGALHPGGSFVSEVQMSTGEATDLQSAYYPGEAIFALTHLYRLDGDERWLDAAEQAAGYLVGVRDGGLATADLPTDHWLLYALSELLPHRPNDAYLDHAMRITRRITDRQQVAPEVIDWRGSYESLSSTSTATRSEGLCAAYGLAVGAGLAEDATRIRVAVELGLRFQLQTQFRPETALYLADPQRVLGAFHRDLTNFEIRNDYVQHNVSSLLCAARILDDDGS